MARKKLVVVDATPVAVDPPRVDAALDPAAVSPPAAELAGRIAEGLHKLSLAARHHDWVAAQQDGLSPTQAQLLALLVIHGPESASALQARVGLSLPTVSDAVTALVDKGLVERRPDPARPRAKQLVPTRAGRARGQRARGFPEFFARAAESVSPADQRALYRAVLVMIRTLQEQGLVPVSGLCVTCVHFRPNVRTGDAPHHCGLVDAPLRLEALRLDCPEHERAGDAVRATLWEAFA